MYFKIINKVKLLDSYSNVKDCRYQNFLNKRDITEGWNCHNLCESHRASGNPHQMGNTTIRK